MSKPTVWHFKLLARLARYLLVNSKRGLIYRPRSSGQEFKSYIYCDGALNLKAATGVALFLGEPDLVEHINKSAAVVAFTTKETIAVDSSN